MKSLNKRWQDLLILLFSPLSLALAAGDPPCGPGSGKICNPLANSSSITELIHNVLIGLLTLGIPLIALAIIYSGFKFVAARGNSEKLGEAKMALMYTLIGAAILFGAWTIATVISNTVKAL